MDPNIQPKPIKHKFFTPGVIVLVILVINGLVFAAMRFIFGIGSVTNLNDQHPWGIWIGIDVAVGVALAAGGFTTSALAHIFNKEEFHVVVRPALLTAMLGYTFVAMGVAFDLGRYYNIWHPLFWWNPNSALFEVGICVMAYLTVLYIEFIPILIERFKNRVNLKGVLSFLVRPLEGILHLLDRIVNPLMFFFIIMGVVLSCLHQSSLGTMMIIAGQKIHPLWQTPILPFLFLLSAISVGFPMVIMESLISSRSFGMKPEMHVLSKLGRMVGPLLGIYLAFKLGDMVIRGTYVYLIDGSFESFMFLLEVVVGVIVPMRMFFHPKVLRSPPWIFTASILTIFGVFMNRVNDFIIAYSSPYQTGAYVPSIGEISVTLGFISMEILLYRLLVMIFPVIGQPVKGFAQKTKFALRGATK